MFQRIKRALSSGSKQVLRPPLAASVLPEPLSEWAATQGFAFEQGSGRAFSLRGQAAGKPWRMELGPPTRKYIQGDELRGRADLGLPDDLMVMLLNRSLKDTLEKMAYSGFTDGLQTMADASLPEEVRWLALFEEVGWDHLPRQFWGRFAVVATRKENAQAWITPALAEMLLEWPEPAPHPEAPFMMTLARGKAYLRMQYEPADLALLQHVSDLFTEACEAAVSGFSAHVSI